MNPDYSDRNRFPIPHPDSCSCDNCTFNRPRHRTRRRRHKSLDDYQARKFWEYCVIARFANVNYRNGAVENADAALVAWRERWEGVPEAGPCVSPFTSDKNPEVHSPDYCSPEDEGGNFGVPARFRSDVPTMTQEEFGDYAPPLQATGAMCEPVSPHRFIPVTDSRYCGECGGGKLHEIHYPETKKAMEAIRIPPDAYVGRCRNCFQISTEAIDGGGKCPGFTEHDWQKVTLKENPIK